MKTPGVTQSDAGILSVGDWVERRYGYGEARWGRITGRAVEGHDCWAVAATNGSVYRDLGHDLARSTQPPQVDSDFAGDPYSLAVELQE